MPNLYTLTGDFDDLLGGDGLVIRKAYIETNIAPDKAIVNTTGKKIRLGWQSLSFTAGNVFTADNLVGSNSTDLNIPVDTLQYQVVVEYAPGSAGPRETRMWRSGWFFLNAASNLADLAVTDAPTPVTGTLDADVANLVNPTSQTGQKLSATYATGGEVRSKVKTDGTDQTATLAAELADLVTAGGGTLVLPEGTITLAGTLTIPNDNVVPVPRHGPVTLRGQGVKWDARSQGTFNANGTVLDIKGIDTYGKIKDNAVGLLAFHGITFTDSAATTSAFIYTTNATLHVDQCAFVTAKQGAACDQDAIVCGGTQQIEGGSGWDEGFQGYGTVISRNYFQGIRRAVYGRAFFNANSIRENTVWQRCGSNLAGGAPFEIDGRPANPADPQHACGNTFVGNLIEMAGGYAYAFKLRYAKNHNFLGNGVYDLTASAVAAHRFEDGGQFNFIIEGYRDGVLAAISESAAVDSWNTLLSPQQDTRSFFSEGITSGRAIGLAPDGADGVATHTWQAYGLQVLHSYNGAAANRFYDSGAAFGGGDSYGPAISAAPDSAGQTGIRTKRPTAGSGADLFEAVDENNAKLSRIDKAGRVVTKVATAPVLGDLTDGEVALYTDGAGALKLAVRVAGVLTIKTVTTS